MASANISTSANKDGIAIGDTVASKTNPLARGITYTVVEVFRTTCWTRTNDNDQFLHKGVPYSCLSVVKKAADMNAEQAQATAPEDESDAAPRP